MTEDKPSITIDINEFIKMSNEEKDKLMDSLPPEIVKKLIETVLYKTEGIIDEVRDNDKQIKETELKMALLSYTNFDQSDIRINFTESDIRKHGFVMARCHRDHIEIIAKSWVGPMKTFENIIRTINHESIHPIVDRIMLEDGFDYRKHDTEWMFYAGNLDGIEGIEIHASPMQYMDMDVIKNSMLNCKELAEAYQKFDGDFNL